jgi:hypothetical protein
MAQHDDTLPTNAASDSGTHQTPPERPAQEAAGLAQQAASPLDLEAMETSIRDRLRQLIGRAKQVQKTVKQLRSRAEPIVRTRAAAMEFVDAKKSWVRPLIDVVRRQSERSARAIDDVTSELDYQLSLRDDMLGGGMAAYAQFQAVTRASFEEWFRAVNQRHADLLLLAGSMGQWLETSELRWMPASFEVKASRLGQGNAAASPPTSGIDQGAPLR